LKVIFLIYCVIRFSNDNRFRSNKDLRKSDDREMDPAEKYGEDSESEDELGNMEQLEIENGLDEVSGKNGSRELDISVVQAKANYVAAGTEVLEEADRITLANNAQLMNSEVNDILDRIVDKIQMRYTPAEFQRVAINALGGMKNVILISPTGSGKMNVPLLTTMVLREKLGNSKGVCIVTQPLSSIMNQKMKNDVCEAAVLSMSGELTTSTGCDDEDASLSCNLQELLNGKFPILFGHPESFDSKLGQHILRELQKLDRVIMLCIDEFHQGGQGHWDSFRPNMMSSSAGLRLYGVKDCPTLAMTATATAKEIKEVVTAMGLRAWKIWIWTGNPKSA
jgi:superfamily II DNA helicase RecQ